MTATPATLPTTPPTTADVDRGDPELELVALPEEAAVEVAVPGAIAVPPPKIPTDTVDFGWYDVDVEEKAPEEDFEDVEDSSEEVNELEEDVRR